jgi:3,4-dihydroxy 2-butanone 4-phosphate synthase/GTP cyclohydrolase II
VEAREGTTTGISAHDRSRTIQALIAQDAKPQHFVKPGHVFPLRARPGGVLTRTGQTEASVDLARLVKDDGTMARVPDLVPFCRQHGLPLVTVADLVAYRLRQEPLVRHLETRTMASQWGALQVHRFQSLLDDGSHLAFVLGDLAGGEPPLVRVHVETLPDDLHGFESGLFQKAMEILAREGRGVLVYLRRHAHTPGVVEEDHVQPQTMSDRDFGVGAQILRQLGLGKMRLLSRHETKYIGLRGFGLDICAHVLFDPAAAAPAPTESR